MAITLDFDSSIPGSNPGIPAKQITISKNVLPLWCKLVEHACLKSMMSRFDS